MAMKSLLGVLFIFMLIKCNHINADGDFEQLSSSMFGKYDGNVLTNTSRKSPEHFRLHYRRQSGMELGSCKSCGLSNSKKVIRTSIIRGDNVSPPYKYPWMADIKKYIKKGGKTFIGFCSGAIISEYYVLTATHCVIKHREPLQFIEPENVFVSFVTSTNKLQKGPPVQKVIPHPQYVKFVKHDIALLKFKKKLNCDRFKSPICLPPYNLALPKGAMVTGSGWGLTVMGDQQSSADKLKEGKFKMTERMDACPVPSSMVKEMHYCMQGLNEQVTCNGDSGGPAFYKHEGRYYLIGILSSGTCNSKYPFIFYTSVQYHLKWIYENMIPYPAKHKYLSGESDFEGSRIWRRRRL